ncbi:MAG: helix-turn-helix transcriptional regulator [Bacteroidales bacterium]|nr:helix-turn-helix transcriptional regulator [Bacteroidales bacterium]
MEKNFQIEIAANILKILSDKGISQAELSRRTEIDAATISKIFSGQTRLNVNALSEISTAIDVPVIDIITYPDKYVRVSAGGRPEPVEAILQIKLQKEKKDQVLKLIFGEHNIEILNK